MLQLEPREPTKDELERNLTKTREPRSLMIHPTI